MKIMKNLFATIFCPVIVACQAGSKNVENSDAVKKSAEAKILLGYITKEYAAGKTLAGQMDLTWDSRVDMTAKVYNDTKKYPAIMGYDFMNYTSCPYNGSAQTEKAIAWGTGKYSYDSNYKGNKKGIVTFCWHWRDPLAAKGKVGEFYTEKCSFRIPYKDGALDQSTEEFKAIKEDLDVVAGELQKIKKAGIAVLWRPLHEAAGNVYNFSGGTAWFWWGAGDSNGKNNAEAYKALYKYMYEYFSEKGLDNLIWVWNGQAKEFYPGDEYCDIVGWDVYGQWNADTTAYTLKNSDVTKAYNTLLELKTNKPIALSENGAIPSELNKWAYFMVWNDHTNDEAQNFWSNDKINPNRAKIYSSENVITLDKLNF